MRAFAGVLIALSIVSASSAQTVPPPRPSQPGAPGAGPARDAAKTGTAVLAGRVVNLENGRPLRRAVVRASSTEVREGRSVSTDADGRWEIKDLPAGRFSIAVQKGGYVPLSYGQRRPFEQGKPVDLADGQRVDKLEIALPKGSVLAGRIADEFGEPIAGARVSAMRHRFMGGQRRLMPVPSAGASDTTDDLGQYRLHGLSPGDYYVSGSLSGTLTLEQSADRTGYAPTYYPGTPALNEAQRVTLAVAQELPEINFALAPTRVAKIAGTAMTSNGKPMSNGMIMLTSAAGIGVGGTPLVGAAMTQPDGSFTISNVAPGEYRLEMIAAGAVESMANSGTAIGMTIPEAASMAITVAGQDVTGLVLAAAPTSTATGRVAFDGTPPSESAIAAVTVLGMPESQTALPLGGLARVRGDGAFEAKGLTGKRFMRINPPTGWYLKSVTINDTDVTDTAVEFKPGEDVSGVEFLLTQRTSTLTGTVRDAKGEPLSDYVVVAFASDSRKWGTYTRFVRTARPDQSGGFKVTGLPPEDYLVIALDYLEPGEEGDTELLERLRAGATPVSIADGGSKAIDLKLSR
jgi:protocatechuate 3,4-dioxygenase beta subunit